MAAVMPKTMMAIKRRYRIAPFSCTHLARREDNPPYNRGLIAATQTLVDAIGGIAGSTAVGFTSVDPAAFFFPNERR